MRNRAKLFRGLRRLVIPARMATEGDRGGTRDTDPPQSWNGVKREGTITKFLKDVKLWRLATN